MLPWDGAGGVSGPAHRIERARTGGTNTQNGTKSEDHMDFFCRRMLVRFGCYVFERGRGWALGSGPCSIAGPHGARLAGPRAEVRLRTRLATRLRYNVPAVQPTLTALQVQPTVTA